MEMTQTVQQACSTALNTSLDAAVFRALGDPVRLAIVIRLATGSGAQTVGEISGCCETHLSGVSRHLAHLRRVGIVSAEKSGREVRYRLNYSALAERFTALVAALSACKQYCCQD